MVADDEKGGVATQSVTVNVQNVVEIKVESGSAGFNYAMDGVDGAALELVSGQKYILDGSGLGTIFWDSFGLSVTQDGTAGGGVPYTNTEIVVRDDVTQTITINASEYVPQLYYYSGFSGGMAGMGGSITTPVVLKMTADGGDYYVNGVQHGLVDLDPGKLYKFDVSDGSMAGHPLALSTTLDGTRAGGDEYDGSGYNRDSDGNVWLLAATDTPTLYYYCGAHDGMGGEASLFPATPATGTVLSFEGYTDGFEDHAAFGRNTTRDVEDKTEEDGTTVRTMLKVEKADGA